MEGLSTLTERLKLLCDPTRVRILSLLDAEELSVGELCDALGLGQSSTSNHLAKLKEAALVADRRNGTRSYYRFVAGRPGEAAHAIWEWLEAKLSEDETLQADRQRMEEIVLARQSGDWVDRAAGSLDRRYVPGRSFASVAVALSRFMDLGDCVDMGSGDGALIDLLLPACRSLTCIDLHPRMVEHGQQRARQLRGAPLRFLEADMQEPPLEPESADTVLFLQSLQYAQEPKRAIQSAFKILRPQGRVLVQTLQKHADERMITDYGHLHRGFTQASLRSWLTRAGFEPVFAERAGHDHRQNHLALLVASGCKPGRA
ncbi:MAG: hypothetical protein CSA62_14605 [Planctomycetota bacterium]|nr:MAG: hypothetical protein CSA62_14605 [Planctomycetota bacterium]